MTHAALQPQSPAPPRHGPVVLSLTGVTRVHGQDATAVHALRGVDLQVRMGELVAVMGPSGSGKSTLLTLAGGLDTATSGTVVVAGSDLGELDVRARARLRRRHIGYVFQDFNLIPALTAAENVSLPRELDGIGSRTARREALEALTEVGIPELADRFPEEMSGGQQQRVAIARALVGPRRVVLADEPTGALDSSTGEDVMRILRARVDAGAAGLMVTHDARYAAWADRTIFLRDGLVSDAVGAALGPESLLEPAPDAFPADGWSPGTAAEGTHGPAAHDPGSAGTGPTGPGPASWGDADGRTSRRGRRGPRR